jgi:hypothetical protein
MYECSSTGLSAVLTTCLEQTAGVRVNVTVHMKARAVERFRREDDVRCDEDVMANCSASFVLILLQGVALQQFNLTLWGACQKISSCAIHTLSTLHNHVCLAARPRAW